VFPDQRGLLEVEIIERYHPVQMHVAAQASNGNEQVAVIPFALIAGHEQNFVQTIPRPSRIL